MSASQLYGPGTPVKNARGTVVGFNGAGTDEFTQRNPFWEVGLLGTIPKLPGEGSMEFSDMFGYMDSPAPAPSGQNIFDILRFNMDSPLKIPMQSNYGFLNSSLMPNQSFTPMSSFNSPDLNLMSGVMNRINPQIPFNSSLLDSPLMPRQPFIPRPSSHDNGLTLMRGMMNRINPQIPFNSSLLDSPLLPRLMDGPFHNVVYTTNNNPVDFLREYMDPPPLDFNGLTPIEFISALGNGYDPRLPTPIARVANQFRPRPPIEPVVLQQIRVPGPQVRLLDGYF
jgi:hypothetical protein